MRLDLYWAILQNSRNAPQSIRQVSGRCFFLACGNTRLQILQNGIELIAFYPNRFIHLF